MTLPDRPVNACQVPVQHIGADAFGVKQPCSAKQPE